MRPSILRPIAAGTLFFFASSLFSPLAEANLWQERRAAASSRPVQYASAAPGHSAIGALPPPAPLARRAELEAPARSGLPEALSRVTAALPASGITIREIDPAAGGGPVVVLLQDVHMNVEAQTNMSDALGRLVDEAGVRRIGVEGAFAPFDLGRFRTFPDRALLRRVADDFLAADLLAAPSHAALALAAPGLLVTGVDDRAAYDANVAAYRTAAAGQAPVRARLRSLRVSLAAAKTARFGRNMSELDRAMVAHRDGTMGLGTYLRTLSARVGRTGPAVSAFLTAYGLEAGMNFERVERERRAALEKLTTRMSDAQVKELVARASDFRSGRLSIAQFHRYLQGLCVACGASMADYPNFDRYVRYVVLADGINADALQAETDALEEAAIRQAAPEGPERRLAELDRRLSLLDRLTGFAVTPREWDRIAAEPRVYLEVPAAAARLAGGPAEPLDLSAYLDFYRYADQRSNAIVTRLLDGAPSTAALVVGGFHTPRILSLLKARGCSVVVCSPRLTRIDGSGTDYLSIFAREKLPLEKLFAGERLTLAPTVVNLGDRTIANEVAVEAAARLLEASQSAGVAAPNVSPGIRAEARGDLVAVTTAASGDRPVTVLVSQPGDNVPADVQTVGPRVGVKGDYLRAPETRPAFVGGRIVWLKLLVLRGIFRMSDASLERWSDSYDGTIAPVLETALVFLIQSLLVGAGLDFQTAAMIAWGAFAGLHVLDLFSARTRKEVTAPGLLVWVPVISALSFVVGSLAAAGIFSLTFYSLSAVTIHMAVSRTIPYASLRELTNVWHVTRYTILQMTPVTIAAVLPVAFIIAISGVAMGGLGGMVMLVAGTALLVIGLINVWSPLNWKKTGLFAKIFYFRVPVSERVDDRLTITPSMRLASIHFIDRKDLQRPLAGERGRERILRFFGQLNADLLRLVDQVEKNPKDFDFDYLMMHSPLWGTSLGQTLLAEINRLGIGHEARLSPLSIAWEWLIDSLGTIFLSFRAPDMEQAQRIWISKADLPKLRAILEAQYQDRLASLDTAGTAVFMERSLPFRLRAPAAVWLRAADLVLIGADGRRTDVQRFNGPAEALRENPEVGTVATVYVLTPDGPVSYEWRQGRLVKTEKPAALPLLSGAEMLARVRSEAAAHFAQSDELRRLNESDDTSAPVRRRRVAASKGLNETRPIAGFLAALQFLAAQEGGAPADRDAAMAALLERMRANPILDVGAGKDPWLRDFLVRRLEFPPQNVYAVDPALKTGGSPQLFRGLAEEAPASWNGRFAFVFSSYLFNREMVSGAVSGTPVDVEAAAAAAARMTAPKGIVALLTNVNDVVVKPDVYARHAARIAELVAAKEFPSPRVPGSIEKWLSEEGENLLAVRTGQAFANQLEYVGKESEAVGDDVANGNRYELTVFRRPSARPGGPEVDQAEAIVSSLSSGSPTEAFARAAQVLTEGTSPGVGVNSVRVSGPALPEFSPFRLADAIGAALTRAVAAGRITRAEADSFATALAAVLAGSADRRRGPAFVEMSEAEAGKADGKDLLTARWLAPREAAPDALAIAREWLAQPHREGDRLVLMAGDGVEAARVTGALAALNAGDRILVRDGSAHADAVSLLRSLPGGLSDSALASQRFRFLLRNDVAVPQQFFDVGAAGLPASAAASLRDGLEVFLIVSQIMKAVPLEMGQIPSFEALRTVMIQA